MRGRMEKEAGECAVKEALVDIGHEVAGFLGGGADGNVVWGKDDAGLVHQTDLFGVVAGEVVMGG